MSEFLTINVVNTSDNDYPKYANEFAAGMDLRAFLKEPMSLIPGDRVLIPTGLFIAIPTGYEGQVRPRSGMVWKQGLTVANSPGTIDSDYRGEVKVMMYNISENVQTISPGDRIAQLVISKYEMCNILPVEKLSETERGEGGFGSTGVK